jgi:hypothetical protein
MKAPKRSQYQKANYFRYLRRVHLECKTGANAPVEPYRGPRIRGKNELPQGKFCATLQEVASIVWSRYQLARMPRSWASSDWDNMGSRKKVPQSPDETAEVGSATEARSPSLGQEQAPLE